MLSSTSADCSDALARRRASASSLSIDVEFNIGQLHLMAWAPWRASCVNVCMYGSESSLRSVGSSCLPRALVPSAWILLNEIEFTG